MATIDPHDDDFGAICNCAVRYAVGRRTYMPGLVIDFIKPHLSELSDKTLWCFQNDLKERARITRNFADDWAGDEWKQFQKLVYEELIRRTNQRTKQSSFICGLTQVVEEGSPENFQVGNPDARVRISEAAPYILFKKENV